MRKLLSAAAFVLLAQAVVSAGVVVSFARNGVQLASLDEQRGVWPGENTIELRLENMALPTLALSAYLLDFQGGDFATGKLDASGWQESSAFAGLAPPWLPDDQSLDTRNGNFRVSGVTGSLSTPFIGPGLPVNTPVLIGTFDVFVDAPAGSLVDFMLSPGSGIDDEMGRLAGAGIVAFGVNDVDVPEPTTLALLSLAIGLIARRRGHVV